MTIIKLHKICNAFFKKWKESYLFKYILYFISSVVYETKIMGLSELGIKNWLFYLRNWTFPYKFSSG